MLQGLAAKMGPTFVKLAQTLRCGRRTGSWIALCQGFHCLPAHCLATHPPTHPPHPTRWPPTACGPT